MSAINIDIQSKGAQDGYLVISPQMTFWKNEYLRYTNFALEIVKQDFSVGSSVSEYVMNIPRQADLLHSLLINFNVPALNGTSSAVATYVDSFAHMAIDTCKIKIGSQVIDEQSGFYLEVVDELHGSKDKNMSELIGKHRDNGRAQEDAALGMDFYAHTKFWFCLAPEFALPLGAIQFHDVEFRLKTRKLARLVQSTDAAVTMSASQDTKIALINKADGTALAESDLKVAVIYMYALLDSFERRLFALSSHEYLIRTVQQLVHEIASGSTTVQVPATFNHPVGQVHQFILPEDQENLGNYTTWYKIETLSRNGLTDAEIPVDPISSLSFTFNNVLRFTEQNAVLWRLVIPLLHNNRTPDRFIYTMSFCLYGSDVSQPSGSLNFSRIDTPKITIKVVSGLGKAKAYTIAEGFNVFRIVGGMGGIAYSS